MNSLAPAGAEHWSVRNFFGYGVRVPLISLNVFNYHESRLFLAVTLSGVVHHHESVVARAGGNKKRVVNSVSQVLGQPSRFSVQTPQRALRVINVNVIVRLRFGPV